MTTSRLTDEQVDFLERRAAGGRLPTLHEVRALLSEVRERREGERASIVLGEPIPQYRGPLPGSFHDRPAPAAGSPDTRTLGKDEERPAAADPRDRDAGDRPAHMKPEGE